MWTFVARAFTVFACRTSRAAEVPRDLLGPTFGGVIQCDRARMYWGFDRLQYGWAHLVRDFKGLTGSTCGVTRRLWTILFGANLPALVVCQCLDSLLKIMNRRASLLGLDDRST